jgi:hypothetical protein
MKQKVGTAKISFSGYCRQLEPKESAALADDGEKEVPCRYCRQLYRKESAALADGGKEVPFSIAVSFS